MSAPTVDRLLALWLWKAGWLESSESRLLKTLCRPGMTALDIGANIGFHTLVMAAGVGAGGRVVAFEPDSVNASALEQNLALNGIGNVTVVSRAVGASTELRTFWHSPSNSGGHSLFHSCAGDLAREVTLPVVALDDYLAECQSVDVVKMDIQGAEGLAILGMRKLLARSADAAILLELWPDGLSAAGTDLAQVLANMKAAGFGSVLC